MNYRSIRLELQEGTDYLPSVQVTIWGGGKKRQRDRKKRHQWLACFITSETKFSKALCSISDVYVLLDSVDVVVKKFRMHKHWKLVICLLPTSHQYYIKCLFWPQVLWEAWLTKIILVCEEWTWSPKLLETEKETLIN